MQTTTTDELLRHPGGQVVQVQERDAVLRKLHDRNSAISAWEWEILESFEGHEQTEVHRSTRRRLLNPPSQEPAPKANPRDVLIAKIADHRGILALAELVQSDDWQRKDVEDQYPLLKRFCKKRPELATPLFFFAHLFSFVGSMNEANKARNKRIEYLEARLKDLQTDFGQANAKHGKQVHELSLLMTDMTFRPSKVLSDDIEKRLKHLEGRAPAGTSAASGNLETRVKALEMRPELAWCGVYKSGETYSAGNLITRSGGLWLCQKRTAATPGTDSASWRLVCKEGQAR